MLGKAIAFSIQRNGSNSHINCQSEYVSLLEGYHANYMQGEMMTSANESQTQSL